MCHFSYNFGKAIYIHSVHKRINRNGQRTAQFFYLLFLKKRTQRNRQREKSKPDQPAEGPNTKRKPRGWADGVAVCCLFLPSEAERKRFLHFQMSCSPWAMAHYKITGPGGTPGLRGLPTPGWWRPWRAVSGRRADPARSLTTARRRVAVRVIGDVSERHGTAGAASAPLAVHTGLTRCCVLPCAIVVVPN